MFRFFISTEVFTLKENEINKITLNNIGGEKNLENTLIQKSQFVHNQYC